MGVGDPALEPFFDATQEMLSGAAVNLDVALLNPTTVRVPAGTGHDQVSLSIQGQYRYVTAPVDRAHPGGGAGIYDLYATSAANDPTTFVPVGGSYAFALAIVAAAATPVGVSLYRKIGHLTWDGAAITSLVQDAGPAARSDARFGGVVPIGGTVSYGGAGDPPGGSWLLGDGRLIDKTTYAAYFAAVGHKFNGGVDPGANKVRIQDKRGRGTIGADNMATAQGAAGRLPNSNRAAGQNGGGELHHHSHVSPVSNRVGVAKIVDPATATSFMAYAGDGKTGRGIGANVSSVAPTQDLEVGTYVGGALAGTYLISGSDESSMAPYECENFIVRVA